MTIADITSGPARAIPVLASLDIAATKSFYVDKLGFSEIVSEDTAYLIKRRGALELNFWLASDKIHLESTSCYIGDGEVAALYEEFLACGVPRLSPFTVRPWNLREFHFHDVHGNLLRFGCASDEPDGY